MKAMMITDLVTSKSYFISQTILSLVVAIFMTLVMGNLYVILPVIGCLIPFSLFFSLLAFDERNGWERFRLTLPISRNQAVMGRYMSGLVLVLGSTLLAAVLFGVCVVVFSALIGVVPLNEDLVFQLQNLRWQAVLAIFVAPIVIILIFFMITLPLAARFGLTKSIRMIPLAFFALVMLAMLGIQSFGGSLPPFVTSFIEWAAMPESTVILLASAVVITLALYAASCFIATKVYAKREL